MLEYSSFNLGQSFIFAGIFIPKFRAFIYYIRLKYSSPFFTRMVESLSFSFFFKKLSSLSTTIGNNWVVVSNIFYFHPYLGR